jgi:hypothetical protein
MRNDSAIRKLRPHSRKTATDRIVMRRQGNRRGRPRFCLSGESEESRGKYHAIGLNFIHPSFVSYICCWVLGPELSRNLTVHSWHHSSPQFSYFAPFPHLSDCVTTEQSVVSSVGTGSVLRVADLALTAARNPDWTRAHWSGRSRTINIPPLRPHTPPQVRYNCNACTRLTELVLESKVTSMCSVEIISVTKSAHCSTWDIWCNFLLDRDPCSGSAPTAAQSGESREKLCPCLLCKQCRGSGSRNDSKCAAE